MPGTPGESRRRYDRMWVIEMEIDATTLNSFFAALTALLLIIIAWFNRQRTASALITASATSQTAITNQAMAAVPPTQVAAAVPVTDTRARDAAGRLTTTQTGSQYWMDAGYTGPEPDAATKAAYTDALLAYNKAVVQARALADKYGTDNISPRIAELAK